jgi:hypothetical protein
MIWASSTQETEVYTEIYTIDGEGRRRLGDIGAAYSRRAFVQVRMINLIIVVVAGRWEWNWPVAVPESSPSRRILTLAPGGYR